MDHESTTEILRCLVIAIVLSVGVVLLYKKTISRAHTILGRWVAQNGFELLHSERRFFSGPFTWWAGSGNRIVFFVIVRDLEHNERSAWVRCGSWDKFIFSSDGVQVKWEKTNVDARAEK